MIREHVINSMKLDGYDLLTIEEVAHLARVSEATIRRCIYEGIIEPTKLRSGSVRIKRSEAKAYIDGKQLNKQT